MINGLDLTLVAIVVLGGATLHVLVRSAWIASTLTTLACMLAAGIYFETASSTAGGAPITGIAIITIGIASFVAAAIVGVVVGWARTRILRRRQP